MREIKFRGKRIDTDKWVYGYYFETPLTAETWDCGHFGEIKRYCISDNEGVVYEIKHKTLGEYTGLKGKNGEDIYEGDIVKVEDALGKYNILQVMFVDGCYEVNGEIYNKKFRNYLKCLTCNNAVEVIGNICENPKLLKGGKQ